MKLSEAQDIINDAHGYLVHFEHYGDGVLRSDHFPDVRNGEAPFVTSDEAIEMGEKFAKAMFGKACNFYLIRGDNFAPVGLWRIENRQISQGD